MRVLAMVTAIALTAPAVRAETLPVIYHPKWDATPTPDAFTNYYPQKAHDQGVEGDVRMRCALLADGGLTGCSISYEDPAGYGFGAAALKLAPLYRARNQSGAGPVGTVTIPLYFRLPNVIRPGDGALVMTLSEWDARPTAAQMEAATPPGAGSGRATLLCQVGEGGYMKSCRVAMETPAGKGFAAAALSLTSDFRAAPVTSQGVPVEGGAVSLTLQFGKAPPPLLLPPAPPAPQQ